MGEVDRRGGAALTTSRRRRRAASYDAVIVGAGPNGLVAANVLADAGWRVVVLEARGTPGGAVASARSLDPEIVTDVCSAFYPLAAASPAMLHLELEDHGLEWCHAPVVLANPLPGGDAVAVHHDVDATAADLAARHPGDGDSWCRLSALFDKVRGPLLGALCTPFPPARPAASLVRSLGLSETLRFARLALLPVRRFGEEELGDPGARLLFAGCTAHTDLSPEASGGAFFGWLLAMLGQRVGFPVPKGGAAELTGALVRRLESKGGEIACHSDVVHVTVRAGRAIGVVTAGGTTVRARRAVLADVAAPALYGTLVDAHRLPRRTPDDVRRFDWDRATIKIDWVVNGSVPWRADAARRAGTVHLAHSVDELTRHAAELALGEVPSRPFVVLGQAGVADPSRAPQGRGAIWAYTHVPARVRADPFGVLEGTWDEEELSTFADRIETRIEQHAPGFRALVAARQVSGPAELEAHDANLVHGAVGGGTAALHQQLVFRPVPGLGRPETPVRGLYLASASAHPGGGVHGACGWNAAQAALRAHGAPGRAASLALVAAQRRLAR
ncbi:MAG: phytoene desaturase family protein [Acidimicrobiales bacterium]